VLCIDTSCSSTGTAVDAVGGSGVSGEERLSLLPICRAPYDDDEVRVHVTCG